MSPQNSPGIRSFPMEFHWNTLEFSLRLLPLCCSCLHSIIYLSYNFHQSDLENVTSSPKITYMQKYTIITIMLQMSTHARFYNAFHQSRLYLVVIDAHSKVTRCFPTHQANKMIVLIGIWYMSLLINSKAFLHHKTLKPEFQYYIWTLFSACSEENVQP